MVRGISGVSKLDAVADDVCKLGRGSVVLGWVGGGGVWVGGSKVGWLVLVVAGTFRGRGVREKGFAFT